MLVSLERCSYQVLPYYDVLGGSHQINQFFQSPNTAHGRGGKKNGVPEMALPKGGLVPLRD